MKHFTKIWLLQVLWLFLSFHTSAVPRDFSGKHPSLYSTERFYSDATSHINAPPPPPISGSSSVCESGVAVYTYPATPGYVYIWNVTNGTGTPSGNTFNVTWGNPGSGTVTLIVKNASGVVVDTQSLPVTINSKPYPYITASFSPSCKEKKGEREKDTTDCLMACDSSYVTYSTPSHAGSTYTWTVVGANSFTPGANTVSVYWGAPGTGLIRVEETNSSGCTNAYEKCVTIIESPDAFFTSVPAAIGGVIYICSGQTVQFTDHSTGSVASPLMDWTWDFGDGTTSTSKNPSHTFYDSPSNTYNVKMYVENECHCGDGYDVKVVVSKDPPPIIECISTVCRGATADYHTPSGCPGATYNWTVTGGVITSSLPYGPDIQVQWGASGPGIVSLAILGCPGVCPTKASVVVSIISPTATISGPNPACYFSNGIYSIPNMPGCIYTWTVTNGTIISGSGTEQVEVNWYSGTSGTISVTYVNPTLHCDGSASMVVNFRPPFTISGANNVCNGSSSLYTATSGTPAENVFYQWTVTNSSNVVVAGSSGSNTYNINWTFGPGIYQIAVSNLSGAFCNSPQTYFVTVSPAPPPPTVVSGPIRICPGSSYLYSSAPSIPGTFIQWNVTNGTPATASGNSLTVTWGASGPYAITARQVYMLHPSCPSIPFGTTVTSKLPPVTPVISGPTTVCKNTIQTYSTSNSDGDSYTWTINNPSMGSIISGQGTSTVTVQWNNTGGTANLGVSVVTCGGSPVTASSTITLTNPPAPVITPPVNPICVMAPTPFSTPTSGSAYSWDFGDGTPVSNLQNPSHPFTAAGTYHVTLTVKDPNGCPGESSVVLLVNVKPIPDAFITPGGPTAFCPGAPINVTLYVTSLLQPGSTVSWYRSGSFVANGTSLPVTTAGAYTAVVTNVHGCSTTSNQINVIQLTSCTGCSPVANTLNFTANKVSCLTYNFPGNISANGRILGWNFDDPYNGASSTLLNPSHTYSEPGYYNVSLRARFPRAGGLPTDSCDRDTVMTIVVPLKAKFNYEITCGGATDYKINFFDLSTYVAPYVINPTTGWSWSFPGGTPSTSTAQNPTGISFPAGTTPNVTLTINTTVTPPVGGYNCTITQPVVIPSIPNLSIVAPDSTCQGNPVVFTTTTPTGVVNSWLWSFGDGASSLLKPTTRTYEAPTAGLKNVVLTITDQFGCIRTFNKNIFVNTNTVSPSVSPAGPVTFCAGSSATLTASVTGATAPYKYLWSTVDTIPSIIVTQTGEYWVEITDRRSCRNRSNTVKVIANPVPQAMIVGDNDYCYGQATILSGYQGPGYTYTWSRNGVFAGSGPGFNQVLPVGTHNFRITITNTANGCTSTSGIYVVIVHPLPPNPAIGVSPLPACEGSPITLTATTTISPYTFNWNTGAVGNSITVHNAGMYTATVIDQYGCRSSRTTQVYEMPDFTNLLQGCYEFCDTADVTLVGPVGIGFSYQWFYNGSPIPGPVGTQKDLVIPVGRSGRYMLEIITSAGCGDKSKEIEVRFTPCRPCETDWDFKDIRCVIDTNGTQVYYFTVALNNPFGPGASYSLSTPGGYLTGLSPATLNPGWNAITGYFVDVPPVSNPFCITGSIYGREARCILKEICTKLPECPKTEPCHADTWWGKVACMGVDAAGNQQYYFEYEIGWPGVSGAIIMSMTSPNGTISNLSLTTLNNGSNTLSGIFTDVSGGKLFCFDMYVLDPSKGSVCKISNCIELPECTKMEPCHADTWWGDVVCAGVDAAGNQQYYFEYEIGWPGTPGAIILSMTSPYGTISNLSLNSLNSGSNTLSGIFTDISGTGKFCFDMYVFDPSKGSTCYIRNCIELPDCKDVVVDCEDETVRLKGIKCSGFDANGHQTYFIETDIHNPFGGSPAKIYVSSPNGGFSNLTPNVISSGWNYVRSTFTSLPPYAGTICVTVIIVDEKTGRTCVKTYCFELPPCDNDGMFAGINNATGVKGGSSIDVNPNPATEQTVISYTFNQGTSRTIAVTDMYGRTLKVFNVADDKGTITLQTGAYSPGVYMVTGFSDNRLVESKRLIIIK